MTSCNAPQMRHHVYVQVFWFVPFFFNGKAGRQEKLQHSLLSWHLAPPGLHRSASDVFASPKHASAMPASPTPNFFSAARRVTDWARLLVSSSNCLFISLLSFWLVVV